MSDMFLAILVLVLITVLIWKNIEYKRSAYYQITGIPYFAMARDTGRYGEYVTYKNLKSYEKYGARFLFNVYIPKDNGQTTEIDVLMICPQGIFVFESKNYSGWIFGNGSQKNWYQTLPAGRGRSHKEHFYNPIMQNRSHINHLQTYLGEQTLMHSVIVFSNRCTLRNITFNRNEASVVNREDVETAVYDICEQISADLLSEKRIDEIYNKLYPLTQVDEITKEQHVKDIHHNLASRVIPQVRQDSLMPVENEDNKEEKATDGIGTETIKSQTTEVVSSGSQISRCPRCGGELILRSATRGANAGNRFYGCSNYPRCRYIQNLTNKTV